MKSTMTLRYIGPPDARRYFIERHDRALWAGDHWSDQRQDAALWASLRDAHEQYNRLQLEPYYGKAFREFECRLVVRVHGDQPFTLAELRDYLMRACRLTLDVEAVGEGPVEGTFTVPMAVFNGLRPIDQF